MPGLTRRQLVLAVSLSGVGSHPAARLREDSLASASWRRWTSLIAEADRGGLELVTLADGPEWGSGSAPDDRTNGHRASEPATGDEAAARLPWLDPTLIACRVAPLTDAVGLVPEVPTVTTEPFLVSTQIATLDYVSGGRAGLSMTVPERASDGDYVGPRAVPPVGDRFAEAGEYIEVVRQLWDSWDDDAEIRDAPTNRFVDRERLHHIDYEGRWLSVKGPSITPRPPQGQPIVAVTIRGQESLQLAAEHGDVAFVAAGLGLIDTARRLDDAVAAAGREPEQVLVLADLEVVLSEDPGAAADRAAQLDALAPRNDITDAANVAGPMFVGTPAELADRMIEQAGDDVHGFRLHPAVIADDLPLIVRRLTDELQTRGARGAHGGRAPSLRAKLGLPRPANRYASSPR
jgi:alkanesulfonate monooxygenase SsuD/methylene tetrahydromethanopterin reductase-like flavin-dependent oxidoreductase (luciferase family)